MMSDNNKTVKTSNKPVSSVNKKRGLWICLSLAILITVGAVALSLYIIKKSYADIEQRVTANQQYAHQAVDRLHNQHQKNHNAITQLQNNQVNKKMESLLYAKYLVRLAQIQLNDLHDLTTGLRLYQQADQVLAVVSHAKVQPLKQAIKSDIKKLSAIKLINRKVLYENLDNVIKQVVALKTTEKLTAPTTTIVSKDTQPVITTSWQRVKATIGGFLQKIFIIEKTNQPVQALLTPTQFTIIKQNIVMKLQQAELALLQHQPIIYQIALKQAINWLDEYQQPQVKPVIKQLKQLIKQPIITKIPALKTKDVNWS